MNIIVIFKGGTNQTKTKNMVDNRDDLAMTVSACGYFHQIKFPWCCIIWTNNEHIPNLQQDIGLNKRPPGLIAPLLKFCNLLGNPPINTTKGRDLIFNEGIKLLNMADNI